MAKIQLKNIVKSWGTSVGVKRMSLDTAGRLMGWNVIIKATKPR